MALTSTVGVWLATITPVEWANPLLAALLLYAVAQLVVRAIRAARKA